MKLVIKWNTILGWLEIFYDEEASEFIYKEYRRKAYSEDYFERKSQVSKEEVLRDLIQKNELATIIKYYRILDAEKLLDKAIASLEGHPWLDSMWEVHNLSSIRYEIPGKEHILYVCGTFYTLNNNQRPVPDFTAVKRIIENRTSVRSYYYRFLQKRWDSFPFLTSDEDSTEELDYEDCDYEDCDYEDCDYEDCKLIIDDRNLTYDDLDLSVKPFNALKRVGITTTLEVFAKLDEGIENFLQIRHLTKENMCEILQKAKKKGYPSEEAIRRYVKLIKHDPNYAPEYIQFWQAELYTLLESNNNDNR